MNYIVLDMEWNQAVCREKAVLVPVRLEGEIIQIGAVKLDGGETFKINIRPKVYTRMHSSVKKLTGITNNDLREGTPFPEAFDRFIRWCGPSPVFLIWGNDDIRVLRANLAFHSIPEIVLGKWYNLQIIFDRQFLHENRQCALASALEKLGLPFDVEHAHDALTDALGTADVCSRLDIEKGIATYNEAVRPSKRRMVYYGFTSAEQGIRECGTRTFKCPICSKELSSDKWKIQGERKAIALVPCDGHELFLRLKAERCRNGRICVKRTVSRADEMQRRLYVGLSAEKEQP